MRHRSPLVAGFQRLVVATGRGALRPLWAAAYRGFARLAAWYLVRGEQAGVYIRDGGGRDDFLPGLSDVDLVLVPTRDHGAPGAAATRVRRRWERLCRGFPPTTLLIDVPRVHEDVELAELAGASALTLGLDSPAGIAAYHGERASVDGFRLLGRPGLRGLAGWQRLAGPELRPPHAGRDRQETRIAAWLELANWWRWAFRVCPNPLEPRTSDMCVKFVAEPARIWLWLVHGERATGRLDALRRARSLLPEEEAAFRWALEAHRALPSATGAPLAVALPAMVRLSARIAKAIAREMAAEDHAEVRLAGVPHAGTLPLADWRALVCPPRARESFEVVAGDPGDPRAVGELAGFAPSGPYPALVAGELMVFPGATWLRSRLRSVKSAFDDPVSFALVAGTPTASFPDVRGWSARDAARRAVSEHAAWIGGPHASRDMLLVAARAGLFLESLDDGRPELTVTLDETERRLAERSGLDDLPGGVAGVQRLVTGLPAFSGAARVNPQPAR